MAIEFRCTSCDKLLSTPDGSQGKQAKCPNCGATVPIPGTAPSPAAAPPGPFPLPGGGAPPAAVNPFGDAPSGIPFKPAPRLTTSSNPYATSSTYSPGITPAAYGSLEGLRHSQVSFEEIWNSSYYILTQQVGPCVLFAVIVIAISFGMNFLANVVQGAARATREPAAVIAATVVFQILSFLLQTYIRLASAAFMIRLARDGRADTEGLSAAGQVYGRGLLVTLALGVLIGLVGLTCVFPPILIGALSRTPEGVLIGMIVGFVLCFIPIVLIVFNFYLSLYFLVDRKLGVIESMQASVTYMSGNKLVVFGYSLVVGLLGSILGLVTCCVGFLFVIPFINLSGAVIYLYATGQMTIDRRPTPIYTP
jgi:hypothetical protein